MPFWGQTPHFWDPPLLTLLPGVPSGSSEAGGDSKATDVPSEGGPAPRRPRKKKSVSWPDEGRLREYFYFELDETERGEPGIPWKTPGFSPRTPLDPSRDLWDSLGTILGSFRGYFVGIFEGHFANPLGAIL